MSDTTNSSPDGAPSTVDGVAVMTPAMAKAAIPLLGFLAAIQGVDPNVANTALVGATRGLSMSGATVSLAASVSTLALAASAVTTGLMADRLGRRKVLVAALLLGVVGDLVVAASPVAAFFLLGRAVEGVAMGAVYGAAFAYIRYVRAPKDIPAAMGIFTAVIGVTAVTFTFIGGSLATVSWRVAFLVVPVLCLLAVPMVLTVLPAQPRVRVGEKTDAVGQLFLAGAVVALIFGCSRLGKGFLRLESGGALLAGLLLFLGFVVWERRYEHHFFPVEIIKHPGFLAAVCAGLIYNFTNAIVFLQLANLWQYVVKLTTLKVSMWQLPFLFAGILGALVFGRLMKRGLTNRSVVLVSGLMTGAGFVALYLARNGTTLAAFLPGAILAGSGCLVASLPYGNLIIEEAPPEYYGPVTSSRTTFGQFFYAAGLALGTVMVDRLTSGGTVDRLEAAGVPPSEIGTAMGSVTAFASEGTQPTTSLGQNALAAAAPSYVDAFGTTMLVTAAVVVLAGVVGWLLLGRRSASPTT